MTERILVTGSTGTVGRSIVQELTARGAAVRAATRNPAQLAQQANVEAVFLDYERPESFKLAFAGVGALALLSPPFGPSGEVEQAAGLIAAAQAAGVRHIVKLSVFGAEASADSPHRQVEQIIERSGVAYTHLRPNFYMQNYLTYFGDDVRRGVIFLPAGDGKQSLVDTRDIGAAFATVLTNPAEHGHRAYTLTGAEALDHDQIADHLSRAVGYPVRYANPSPEEYRSAGRAAGTPEPMIESMIQLYGIVAAGWAAAISPDLPILIGRAPISFAQFAVDHATALQPR
jgi:uncharacterized protein YbjT (DUF2867 family)